MKVMLINARLKYGSPWTPIGLANIASYLRKHNIQVKILDSNFKNLNIWTLLPILNRYRPDFVGISGMTIQRNDALRLGAIIKNIDNNICIIYGGVHFTFLPKEGLKCGDLVVIGEGEETVLEICEAQDYKTVKGIMYKEGHEFIKTEKRTLISNLDKLPIPAYDLLEMERYNDKLITGERAQSILTGRGCPNNCRFCASPRLWERKVRFHSIDYVMGHIKYLVENYNLQNLRIMDDSFTVNKRRVYDFCDKIEENDFKLNMTCLTNIKQVDSKMVKRMKSVGFSIIMFGVESGNNHILKSINKNITRDEIKRAVLLTQKAGLKTELSFMIGNIGETKKTINDSIDFAKELNPVKTKGAVYNYFQFTDIFPGTNFYDNIEINGVKNVNHNSDEPGFIPDGLSKKTLMKLMGRAKRETNYQKFPQIPQIIQRNEFIRRVYNRLICFIPKGEMFV